MAISKKKIFNVLKFIIILYCAIGIALYYLQDRLIFHPQKLSADYIYDFETPFKEYFVALNKEDTISVLTFFTQQTKKGAVLYFHGNRRNIEQYYPQVKQFTTRGYDVWMPDYPGFGKTTGERTEEKMYRQAMQVYKMVAAQNISDSIIIFGKSLGTGIATYVASNSKCKKLILETPYYSITSLYKYYAPIYPVENMAHYKIPLNEFLQQVKCKVVIVHGDDDEVIPYSNAEKLKSLLKTGDTFITIRNGKHNDLAGKPEFIKMLNKEL